MTLDRPGSGVMINLGATQGAQRPLHPQTPDNQMPQMTPASMQRAVRVAVKHLAPAHTTRGGVRAKGFRPPSPLPGD